jgi:ABC-type glycerol-3-phosphate transport system substrate-binding protein
MARKAMRLFLAAAAFLVLLPAIGVSAASAKAKVKWWTFDIDTMPGYLQGFEPRFEAANPDIDLEVTVHPGNAFDFEQKYLAGKMSGMMPDMMYTTLAIFLTYSALGDFKILDSYIENWDQRPDFLESALDMGKVKGSYMGLGVFPAPIMFVYRTDMFEAAGLDPNRPPRNWQELEEYAVKLTRKDAKAFPPPTQA